MNPISFRPRWNIVIKLGMFSDRTKFIGIKGIVRESWYSRGNIQLKYIFYN